MSPAGFKHLRLSALGDVVLVEILCEDVQGPHLAKEFIAELTTVVNEDGTRPILLDLHRTAYFSSMGYSALFKVVKQAKERQRPIRFCDMHPDVFVVAEIVGLKHVVDIHDCRQSALDAFGQSEKPGADEQTDPDGTSAIYTI